MSLAAFIKGPSSTRNNIPGLDGIRGLAVLTIFVFHAEILPHVPGELATTVFFFLSGFLITTLFQREWNKTGDLNLGQFYYRRVLRILPPLYIALAIALLVHFAGHVGDHIITWKAAGNFFQYTNYAISGANGTGGFLPGMILLWSLAVDEHYYLVYAPILKRAFRWFKPSTIAGALLVLCAAALLWRLYLVHAIGDVTYRVSMTTDTRVDSIFWGSILALWRNPAQNRERAAWLARPWAILLGLVLVMGPSFTSSDYIKCTIGYTMEGIGLIPLFTAAILYGGKGYLKFLHSPWLMWMSKISYSFYLLSWLTLSTLGHFLHVPRVERVLLAFVVTFFVASAMHILVERPLMALRKKSRAAKVAETKPVLQPAVA